MAGGGDGEELHVDAVVVGAGPNGLVAASALAEAGWDVVVLEATDHLGGAVRSTELAEGYVVDLFSSAYPLTAASPVLARLDLHAHGLRWCHAPRVLTHLRSPDDEAGAVVHRDPARTAEALDADAPGDGQAWLELLQVWRRVRDPLLDALFTPFPPVRPGAALLRRLGAADALDLVRTLLLPVRRLGEERFRGTAGRALLAGNAAHADASVDGAGSGVYGWLLAMLAQDVGFPVPEGGSSALARALVGAAEHRGAQMRTGERVVEVVVRGGRAVGVRTASGTRVRARRAVLADVPATTLHAELLDPSLLPARLRQRLEAFEWDPPTVKLSWAVDGAVPWRSPAAAGAGTVHLGQDADGLVHWAADLSTGRLPASPFCLMGQTTTSDPTRSPAGTESLWAYTHLPRRLHRAHDDAEQLRASGEEVARRVEEVVERHAPGFRDRVVARLVQDPGELESADPSLVSGAVGGGSSQVHQQLVLRPWPGLGRPETVVEGLYLASASAHPGGGVHGACGWNAARAALATGRTGRRPLRRALVGLTRAAAPDRTDPVAGPAGGAAEPPPA